MCDRCDPLHTAVAELLGDRPFVLHLVETVEPIGDGQAESAVRTMVHQLAPLQVLTILNAFSATMIREAGREAYEDHLAEHFREQLDGARGVLDDVLGDALDREVAQDADEDGDRG